MLHGTRLSSVSSVEKNSSGKKLNEINKQHINIMSALPAMAEDGWKIPSQPSHVDYYVLPGWDMYECRRHCSACQCCLHMYE